MNARHLFACALLALSGSAIAQTQGLLQESLKDCDKNQLTMNVCASYRFDLADKVLNEQYKQNLAALKEGPAQTRLREAQRAWITFRDKDCLADTGPREESGSIWPLLHFSCLEKHTVRRAEDLKVQACGMQGCANDAPVSK
ncbi:lysozyme inhibitor LprI family protein [Herminiimonas fonticola]|uniref:Uncharacterized protein YecT (DUF1311 family) n=1 Tax=Herminiimonas fonticola TaxID=303380 RepID=A0A4R6GI11_9BURK|nr:lysozyme inhibitor LprI family protein [Herminiimonas fonticola]RBA24648.1 hypothetical protein Hfont_0281 [Herminiimonas fonticola]TDN93765.1 uncharacterized protein YecT (DUF1311 family) [Herminiimonas fonticola]